MADHVRIEMLAHGRGLVYVDGRKIEGVRRVGFKAEAGCGANVLELELHAARVDISGPANVTAYHRAELDQDDAGEEGDQ